MTVFWIGTLTRVAEFSGAFHRVCARVWHFIKCVDKGCGIIQTELVDVYFKAVLNLKVNPPRFDLTNVDPRVFETNTGPTGGQGARRRTGYQATEHVITGS